MTCFDAIWFSWKLLLMNLSAVLGGFTVDLVLFPVTNSATTLKIPVSFDSWPPPSESSCFVRKIYRLKITWGMKTYSIDVYIQHTHTCVCDLCNISKVFAFSVSFECSKIIETVNFEDFSIFWWRLSFSLSVAPLQFCHVTLFIFETHIPISKN